MGERGGEARWELMRPEPGQWPGGRMLMSGRMDGPCCLGCRGEAGVRQG